MKNRVKTFNNMNLKKVEVEDCHKIDENKNLLRKKMVKKGGTKI